MTPTSSMFLLAETRDQPMHVGSLQLFVPPDGADAQDMRRMFDAEIAADTVMPLLRKRARRSITSLGQWGWEADETFDLQHHVRLSALPQPGRVLELLSLGSRLHSSLLDRHRPLWELNLVEGLADGRYAIYFKVHHSLIDGVSALRMLSRQLSTDSEERGMPAPWAPRERPSGTGASGRAHESRGVLREALGVAGDVAGMLPALARTINSAIREQGGSLSISAPRSMLNVPITGARRFAAQSWPMDRIQAVGKAADNTVNDVVLAMCAGALRNYLRSMDALPEAPMIAMVPVSLHGSTETASADGGGNAVGVVMCNLGTHHSAAADRLATVHRSMEDGKAALRTMSPNQILAMSALGVSPLAIWPVLRLSGTARPPFNLVISNVPGPRQPMYWNGARLDGLYPLSIPLHGQALNITCTSYSHEIAFGLTGCRGTVPHLQRLLGYLDDELAALEQAVGL